ncbi:hypothetical protein LPTSP4_32190 [Leptospira ryugenii]|uniref:Uncharacterized protein n=1 Tax=Leptospira ryugenii TaxID=1917863 RepID=A0A2P2E486_9LEPT|nr:hypothetical protein [Leptospira ryugenii]GBF51681.1 hypothetical protein LPTSP4_32190 [Leptospira ryugenii]
MRNGLIVSLLILAIGLVAEEATTKSGKKVILNDDFTWRYAPVAKLDSIPSSMRKLNSGKEQTSVITSKYDGSYSISYNPNQWEKVKSSNESAEFGFENTKRTSYSMVIYEGIEIPMESFPEIVLANAKEVDPDAYIIDVEEVLVNGQPGKIVKYRASSKGLNFIFYNFLSSGKFGSIQFIAFTLESNFERDVASFDSLISGLSVKNTK